MEITKKYCVDMHRKMWNKIYEKTKTEIEKMDEEAKEYFLEDLTIDFILEKKREVLEEFQKNGELEIPLRKMRDEYNDCFACLYAFTKENTNVEENSLDDGKYCRSCPLIWDTDADNFQCIRAEYGDLEEAVFDTVDDFLKTIKMIADLFVEESV